VATSNTPEPKRRKTRRQPLRKRPIVLWLTLFAASVFIVDNLVGERGLLAMLRARQEYDQLAATISRVRRDNARLQDEARRLREDPLAIEEVARRDLGLIKAGEKMFIIKDVQPAQR